jgi:hypothetical protein
VHKDLGIIEVERTVIRTFGARYVRCSPFIRIRGVSSQRLCSGVPEAATSSLCALMREQPHARTSAPLVA